LNECGREEYGNTFYEVKTGFNLDWGSKKKKAALQLSSQYSDISRTK
jgi:hypothetical protein